MTVGNEVEYRFIQLCMWGEHLHHNGILREFVRFEKRDHHLVVRTRIIGEDEDGEIKNTNKNKNAKYAFLSGGHVRNDTISTHTQKIWSAWTRCVILPSAPACRRATRHE